LRLLHLPEEVLELLRSGTLTAGHARALITSDTPGDLARQVVAGGLSVRATEALVKKAAAGEQATAQVSAAPRARSGTKDADTKALEGDLSASLGLKVSIEHQAGSESGQIIVNYTNLEQLDDICRILSRP
jgi:ParB family chromosome partitioning protein